MVLPWAADDSNASQGMADEELSEPEDAGVEPANHPPKTEDANQESPEADDADKVETVGATSSVC